MTKRTRILLVVFGVATLAAAVWIVIGLRTGAIASTDDVVDIRTIRPAAPPSSAGPGAN